FLATSAKASGTRGGRPHRREEHMRTSFVCLSLALVFSGCASSSDTGSSDQASETPGVPVVDFPGKGHGMTPDTAPKATLQYFGGLAVANRKVYAVGGGDPQKITPAVTAAKGGIADFFAGITNSKFMDWMNEYDTAIAAQAGSHKGSTGTG